MDAELRRFDVRPRDGSGHGYAVEARTFEAAALAFVEDWSPPVDAEGDVSVIVRDAQDGHEQCFTVDLDSGEADTCA